MPVGITPFESRHLDGIVDLSLRAWRPVFVQLKAAVPPYVYDAFYPEGWAARQAADITAFLSAPPDATLVAVEGSAPVGWIGLRIHPEDAMGEVYILAVDPDRQREGIATLLMDAGFARMRAAGMSIAMVETGDDPGHAASRATYERHGFERWPVARCFRKL